MDNPYLIIITPTAALVTIKRWAENNNFAITITLKMGYPKNWAHVTIYHNLPHTREAINMLKFINYDIALVIDER